MIPGHAFTRRLYAYTAGTNLKQHHHIRVNKKMKMDLEMWWKFFNAPEAYCRPFIDFTRWTAESLIFYMDVMRNFDLGYGGICGKGWMRGKWVPLIKVVKPSIEYLELYTVTAGILAWIEQFRNKGVYIFCNNQSMVDIINKSSSSCKNCMVLIRIITLQGLKCNVRIYARHIRRIHNKISDAISRGKFDKRNGF